ncbi:phosphatase [Aliidongia dinghuensis]|uniref:Phosphatase n=1 Tax=Aliidongia dinghuensis TaxID=1867774 RepID=A0A8J2YQ12_9PROT|nr:metallophosphoesterase [Aliidongia dinghuensis]GGF00242.1 phosphatase [Aliidongia dinghuensis]
MAVTNPKSSVRVAIASDLHLEFGGNPPDLEILDGDADLLVAAGDIDAGTRAVDWLATSPVPVVYIIGNHELYNRDAEKGRAAIALAARAHPHVHVLDDDRIDFDFGGGRRVRILGGTLWTDYRLYGEKQRLRCMHAAAIGINDHRVIRFHDGLWSPSDAAAAFDRTRDFLEGELKKSFDGITLVVTHHAPTPEAIDGRYRGGALCAAFASDVESLMPYADGWIYGHTHSSIDIEIDGCRIVSNQRGYSWEAKGFQIRTFEFSKRTAGIGP